MTDPVREIDLVWNLLKDPIRPVNGWITAPTRPGLGVDLDQAAVSRFAVDRQVVRPT